MESQDPISDLAFDLASECRRPSRTSEMDSTGQVTLELRYVDRLLGAKMLLIHLAR